MALTALSDSVEIGQLSQIVTVVGALVPVECSPRSGHARAPGTSGPAATDDAR